MTCGVCRVRPLREGGLSGPLVGRYQAETTMTAEVAIRESAITKAQKSAASSIRWSRRDAPPLAAAVLLIPGRAVRLVSVVIVILLVCYAEEIVAFGLAALSNPSHLHRPHPGHLGELPPHRIVIRS